VQSPANHPTQQAIRDSSLSKKQSEPKLLSDAAKKNVLPLVGLAMINNPPSHTARFDGLMDMAFRVCRDTGAAVLAVTQGSATRLSCWAGEAGVEEAAWEGESQTKQ
jgi:hypothetical protein